VVPAAAPTPVEAPPSVSPGAAVNRSPPHATANVMPATTQPRIVAWRLDATAAFRKRNAISCSAPSVIHCETLVTPSFFTDIDADRY
jgi:hypothetical protein